MMEIHLARQLESLILVQVIILYKVKLKILSTSLQHPTKREGGLSWTCQKHQDEGLDSQHHGLAVVTSTTCGEGPVGPKLNPVLALQFSNLLVSKLLKFLNIWEVMEAS